MNHRARRRPQSRVAIPASLMATAPLSQHGTGGFGARPEVGRRRIHEGQTSRQHQHPFPTPAGMNNIPRTQVRRGKKNPKEEASSMNKIYKCRCDGEVLLSLLGDLVQGLFFVAAV